MDILDKASLQSHLLDSDEFLAMMHRASLYTYEQKSMVGRKLARSKKMAKVISWQRWAIKSRKKESH